MRCELIVPTDVGNERLAGEGACSDLHKLVHVEVPYLERKPEAVDTILGWCAAVVEDTCDLVLGLLD